MNRFGADYGMQCFCRVCQGQLFTVEKGQGSVNDQPITVMTIRCYRCGTPLEQLQMDWSRPITEQDKVVIEDGIRRK